MEEGGKSCFHVLGERKVGAPARRGPRWPRVCRASTGLSPERRDGTEAGPLLGVPSPSLSLWLLREAGSPSGPGPVLGAAGVPPAQEARHTQRQNGSPVRV